MKKNTEIHHEGQGTVRSYVLGFILSLALTLSAYLLVDQHVRNEHQAFTHEFLFFIIIAFALLQFLVQLKFFLHLDQESGPAWKSVIFFSTAAVTLIIIVGSLWIMSHLNYNMMPAQMNTYLMDSEAMHR